MKKGTLNFNLKYSGYTILALFIFLLPSVHATPSEDFQDHFKKISHYAEEYEIGNINYAQLFIYISTERMDMEDFIGQKNFSTQKAREALGTPSRSSKYLYSKKVGDMVKTENDNDVWERVIYDGKKIKINFKLEPFLYYDEEKKAELTMTGLGLYVELKNSLDPASASYANIDSGIQEIKSLANAYSDDQSESNALALSDKIREFENSLNAFNNQQSSDCNANMQKVFGSNNAISEKLLHEEALLYEGDKFNVATDIEICQSCSDNPWMSINSYKRNAMGGYVGGDFGNAGEGNYAGIDFKKEITSVVNNIVSAESDEKASELLKRLNILQKQWEESSNQLEKKYVEEQMQKYRDNKENSQSDGKAKWDELSKEYRKTSFEERKNFYLDLFAPYKKDEYTFTRTEYRKVIAEHSQKSEVCDNNVDDNQNGQVDCADQMCNGNSCGDNMFCVNNECKKLENYIAPQDNNENLGCKKYDSLPCSGTVIFKGSDSNGCPLEPICVAEKKICSIDSDCPTLRCGKSSCVEGFCKTADLTGCKESECTDGDNKKVNCESGDGLVVAICQYGEWVSTGQECSVSTNQNSEEKVKECGSKSDCSSDQVCSNGECISLPESKTDEISNAPATEPANSPPETASNEEKSSTTTGSVIKAITGFFINGFSIEDKNTKLDEKKQENNNEKSKEGQIVLMAECRVLNEGTTSSLKVDRWGFFSTRGNKKDEEKSKDEERCNKQLQTDLFERKELEKSLNNDFAKWFFEEYLASSAEEWDRRSRAMDDFYWKLINLAQSLALEENCKDYNKDSFNLINIDYTTTYGSMKLWEEFKSTELEGKKVSIISPYMGFWVYPSRDVLEYQMNKTMNEEKFNPWDDSNGVILEQKQIANFKSDKKIMASIDSFISKYGKDGKANIKIVFRDFDKNQDMLAFFAQLNKDNILIVKPMRPENIRDADVNAIVDFNKLLGLMESIQKDTKESEIRRPEWDNAANPKDLINKAQVGISIFYKLVRFVNSVEVTPSGAKTAAISLAYNVFTQAMSNQQANSNALPQMKTEDTNSQNQDDSKLTGNIIFLR